MHRWVRYEAPVMVCVAIDDNGEEPQDIHLARSHDGHPLVYDEHMELLGRADTTAQAAVRETEDREWPDADEWESGPDALRYPGLYDPVDEPDHEDDSDDLDPLDLDEAEPAHAN